MSGGAYYNENDPYAAAWLRELIKRDLIAPGDVDERSIKDVRPDDLDGYTQCHFFAGIAGWSLALRLAGWPDDRAVWTGSCPCQDFSSSGLKAGIDGDRDLWPRWFNLIRERTPGVVFGEQVDDSALWVDRAFDDMEGINYTFAPVVVPACAVGADHERLRLFFVADANGERQPEQGQRWSHAGHYEANGFGEAGRLVDAVRREALPFLCGRHDGVSGRLGEVACSGFGNAIVPQLAAEFITAYMECAA